MSMPASSHPESLLADFIGRHESLRAVLEWIGDRFADRPEVDDSIAREDGEDHDEPEGPPAL